MCIVWDYLNGLGFLVGNLVWRLGFVSVSGAYWSFFVKERERWGGKGKHLDVIGVNQTESSTTQSSTHRFIQMNLRSFVFEFLNPIIVDLLRIPWITELNKMPSIGEVSVERGVGFGC